MRSKTKIFALIIGVIAAVIAMCFVTACGEEPVEPPAPVYKVTSVRLQYNDENITGGTLSVDVTQKTVQLSASVIKDEQADGTVTYVSSEASVATINDSGLVTLLSAGETVITAEAGEKSDSIVLVVGDDMSGAPDEYARRVKLWLPSQI